LFRTTPVGVEKVPLSSTPTVSVSSTVASQPVPAYSLKVIVPSPV